MMQLSPHALEIERQEREAERARLIALGIAHLEQKRAADRAAAEAWIGRPAPVCNYRDGNAHGLPKAANPFGRVAPPITVNGVTRTRREWADALGISYNAFMLRIRRYGPANAVERALAKATSKKLQGQTPGVVDDFTQVLGTGAGSTAQETTNIDFHKDTENADCNG